MKTKNSSSDIIDSHIIEDDTLKKSNTLTIRYGKKVTIFFSIIVILLTVLIILNSGSDISQLVGLSVAIIGLLSTYRKDFFTINFTNKTYSIKGAIGGAEKDYNFEKFLIKDNIPYRVINNKEKKVKSLKFIIDNKDWNNLKEFVSKKNNQNTTHKIS